MDYFTAYQKMKKIVSKEKARPVLQGIHHHRGNIIEATDSHRATRARVDGINFEEHIVNPKTKEYIDGSFPNLDGLFEVDADSIVYGVALSQNTLQSLKSLLKAGKSIGHTVVGIAEVSGTMSLTTLKNMYSNEEEDVNVHMSMTMKVASNNDEEAVIRYVDINHLIHATELFSTQEGFTHMTIQEVGKVIYFSNTKGDLEHIILPKRKY